MGLLRLSAETDNSIAIPTVLLHLTQERPAGHLGRARTSA
ncbi:hypothetical protein T261_2178 [Streptomyces lydicus]|nr:hypothetical protein T261_2178 [Streptomyces lydicus]